MVKVDKIVLKEAEKTEEGRLKIKRIRKLTRINKVFDITKFSGMLLSFYVDYLCVLSLIPGVFDLESNNSIFFVILSYLLAHRIRNKFYYGIPKLQHANLEEIVSIVNELSEEIERTK
jgi:hypothetical protein